MVRRDVVKVIASAGIAGLLPGSAAGRIIKSNETDFLFCLNTSTIRGQNLSLPEMIEVTVRAGYHGVELWLKDINQWVEEGNSLSKLQKLIKDSGLSVETGVGSGEWIVDDADRRRLGLEVMKNYMEILSQLNCNRIVAVTMGAHNIEFTTPVAAERFRDLIELGRSIGVLPHLEFLGASKAIPTLGKALSVAISADDEDARVLLDVYHLYRGSSGINGITLINGNTIEVVHINDYPGHIPKEEMNDSMRVFPGDGVAPLKQILNKLKATGGKKVLSLELFNQDYYKMDAFTVAKTGLEKTQAIVNNL